MKKPIFEELLDRILAFANELENPSRLPSMLDRLVRLSERANLSHYRHPFFLSLEEPMKGSWLQAESEPIEKSRAVRDDLRVTLSRMLGGSSRSVVIDNKGFTFGINRSKEGAPIQLQMCFKRKYEDDPGNISAIMSLLMLILGIKDVRKCPACDVFFVIKKSMRQKVCSPKCKQKIYEANLSPEKKKKASVLSSVN